MDTVIKYGYGYEYRIRVWVRLSDTSMGTSIGYELGTSSGYDYGDDFLMQVLVLHRSTSIGYE